jgi:hypothetical protein
MHIPNTLLGESLLVKLESGFTESGSILFGESGTGLDKDPGF